MRAVIQQVSHAAVEVAGRTIAKINKGLLVYLSIAATDTVKDAQFMAEKFVNLRIFPNQAGKMNRSTLDLNTEILLVSNFTLHGNCHKGRRPAFDTAATPHLAQQLYEKVIQLISEHGVSVEKGRFREYMQVKSVNDGPLTFLLDSSRLF